MVKGCLSRTPSTALVVTAFFPVRISSRRGLTVLAQSDTLLCQILLNMREYCFISRNPSIARCRGTCAGAFDFNDFTTSVSDNLAASLSDGRLRCAYAHYFPSGSFKCTATGFLQDLGLERSMQLIASSKQRFGTTTTAAAPHRHLTGPRAHFLTMASGLDTSHLLYSGPGLARAAVDRPIICSLMYWRGRAPQGRIPLPWPNGTVSEQGLMPATHPLIHLILLLDTCCI